jgi:hypothetical protein
VGGTMLEQPPLDREAVRDELERVRSDFHHLLDEASPVDLRRPSNGTRWTNEQLLFHMLFGYIIVRALLVLVRLLGRLPAGASGAYARLLDRATGPFDTVNYYGARLGARVYSHRRMAAKGDRVIAAVQRRLAKESDASLTRVIHYPVRWDPFFADFMTLAELYRYPTRHYDFHRRQLTLGDSPA